ncbi:hypothetical protein BA895_03865 [Humibacillus sp. DSM 29435]|nr:hypothetical protein BA895_03865 [Humibacillus sp. DSM 29435]
MKSYEVHRHIEAEPAVVWAALTDSDRLIAADTGIQRIDGRMELGDTFTLWSEAVPGRGFKTRVTLREAPLRMVWEGGLPAGLFRGVRSFTLTPSAGGTDFVMREEFTGPMLALIWRNMPDLQPHFDTFAEGLGRTTEATR